MLKCIISSIIFGRNPVVPTQRTVTRCAEMLLSTKWKLQVAKSRLLEARGSDLLLVKGSREMFG